jgi:Helix-turn-helix domain
METLTSIAVQCGTVKPEWLRIPDAARFSGLGRSSLYELIREGKIKSVCLRKRNNSRGVRLISADSLSSLIESAANGGAASEAKK